MRDSTAAGLADDRQQGVPLRTGMRAMLLVASILVFVVGSSLFLWTEQTDRYFAWTIANPLTAAFLGAAYWASGVLELLASRERRWREARIAVPAVLAFTTLTLIVTLVYRDRFHFDADEWTTRFGTWFWLAIYAGVPLIMGFFFVRQGWSTGEAANDDPPLPPWVRLVFLLQGAAAFVTGVWLLADPLSAIFWPWTLTDLTGRAIGAWLVSLGLAAFQVTGENGIRRARPATAAYFVLALLQLVGVARYPDRLDFSSMEVWVYLAFLISMAIAGGYLILLRLHGLKVVQRDE